MVQTFVPYHLSTCYTNGTRVSSGCSSNTGQTGSPFAQAFMCKARTVLGIFEGALEKDLSIITQANEALVYQVKKDNLKWILLMLWVGADIRAPVVSPDDSESTTTALREAAFRGHVEVLRKARINSATDNVVELLDAAPFCRNPEVVEYLLSFKPDASAPVKNGEFVMDSYYRSPQNHLPRPALKGSIVLLATDPMITVFSAWF
jgi:hypothetical protein